MLGKVLVVAGFIFAASSAQAIPDFSFEERLEILESQVREQEKRIQTKLSNCKLITERIGRRAGWCPSGSFVSEVEPVYGTEQLTVGCVKPVLKCENTIYELATE